MRKIWSRRRYWCGNFLDGRIGSSVEEGRQEAAASLRALLGTFWEFFYRDDQGQVLSWLGQLSHVWHVLLEVLDSKLKSRASRLRAAPALETPVEVVLVPVESIHREPVRYGEGRFYGEVGLEYGDQSRDGYFAVPLDAGITYVGRVMDRDGADARLVWLEGIDFVFRRKPYPRLLCRMDPRHDAFGFPVRNGRIRLVLGNVARRNPDWSEHWARVLALSRHDWTRPFVESMQQILDSWSAGSSLESFLRFFAGLLEIPVAEGNETVEQIIEDRYGKAVATDRNVYRIPPGSDVAVFAGQLLYPGQILCDALDVRRLGPEGIPEDLSLLVDGIQLSDGFMRPAGRGGIFLPNESVPLQWTRHNGRWQVRWPLEGDPLLVEEFWRLVRKREDQQQVTLARIITGREDVDQLPLAVLPQSINPCQWAVANLLRFNLLVLVLSLGDLHALWPEEDPLPGFFGSDLWSLVRSVVPPWAAVLLIFSLRRSDTIADDSAVEQVFLDDADESVDSVSDQDVTDKAYAYYVEEPCE